MSVMQAARTNPVAVAACTLVAMFEGLDLQAAGVAAPKLAPALGLKPADLGWFFSASTFGLMLGAAIGGRLSDRFGRKVSLLCSVLLFGVLSLLTGLSDDLNQLIVTRFLTGVGLGGALPNLLAMVAENTRLERRRAAVGILYAGLPCGGALASLVSYFGSDPSDWRMIFYVGGLLPLVALLPLAKVLPYGPVLSMDPKRSGFAEAVFGERRAGASVLLWAGFFLALLAMYLLLSWLPSLLISRGLPRPDAALVQMAFNLCGAVGSIVTGQLMDGALRRGPVVAGVFTAAAASVALASFMRVSLGTSLGVGAALGATVSGTQALLYGLAPTLYPRRVRGTGVGVGVAAGRLGSAAGPVLAGLLLATGLSSAEVLLALVPVLGLSGLAAVFLVRKSPAED
jgi:AAHS family 3-hydroxyphenylpropionic acid transporter